MDGLAILLLGLLLSARAAVPIVYLPPVTMLDAVPVPETFSGPDQRPQAIAASDGVVLAVWSERRHGANVSLCRLFDERGIALGPAHPLPDPEVSVVAAAGNRQFLIVWSDSWSSGLSRGIRALRVSLDGRVLDAVPILISTDGGEPSVAGDGRDYLVTW